MSTGVTSQYQKLINRAARHIKERPVLIVFSGAGMSVDSGLKAFRGDQGLYQQLGTYEKDLPYQMIINPLYFESNP